MVVQPTNPIILIASDDVNLPSTGQPNKTEPVSAIQTTGWDDNQVVAAENLNYIFDNFGEWLTYLKLSTEDLEPRVDDLENRNLVAGNGLTGGGDLSADRTFTLGTPSTLNGGTSNSVTTDSHTHNLDMASQEEAETGTENTKLVTPLRVHEAVPFTFSPSSIGASTESVTLPNGLIMKFGILSGTTPLSVVFDTPFPTGILSLTVSTNTTSSSEVEGWYSDYTVTGFTWRTIGSKPGSFIAIGY